jgi:Fe-S-cluster containining protein
MSKHIKVELSTKDASDICMNKCKALCCRDPYILTLLTGEIDSFRTEANNLGISLDIEMSANGEGWVRFSEYEEQSCPMLDSANSICKIYDNRPMRCRDFPDSIIPGCEISGG